MSWNLYFLKNLFITVNVKIEQESGRKDSFYF